MVHKGTERNWIIVGLSKDFTVLVHTEGDAEPHDSHERPSEYIGLTYLTKKERGILRKGMTRSGRDRRSV